MTVILPAPGLTFDGGCLAGAPGEQTTGSYPIVPMYIPSPPIPLSASRAVCGLFANQRSTSSCLLAFSPTGALSLTRS